MVADGLSDWKASILGKGAAVQAKDNPTSTRMGVQGEDRAQMNISTRDRGPRDKSAMRDNLDEGNWEI